MKFTPQEKKALAGMTLIAAFIVAAVYQIGMRNFWFEAKNTYFTQITDADGLRVGSVVTIAGLRVGEVASLDVDEQNQIVVKLRVRAVVAKRIRSDSVATIFRSFIIGEKRIDLIPGSPDQPVVPNGGKLVAKSSTDLAEFLSGKKLAEMMTAVEGMVAGVNTVLREMTDVIGKYHEGTFNKTFAMVEPALTNFMKLSDDLIVMTHELKKQPKALPQFVDSGNRLLTDANADLFANHLVKDSLGHINQVVLPLAERQKLIESLLGNLEDFSKELKKNPEFTKQILEAVKELTITLKAMQQTWFLKDQADDVKSGK